MTHMGIIVKINGKRIGLDVTWGIFTGYLPLCHLFKNFGSSYLPSYKSFEGKLILMKKEMNLNLWKLLIFIVICLI